MAKRGGKTRLQRKREKDSLQQAVKYLVWIFVLLYLIIKFGFPGLIKMAGFIGNISSSKNPIEKQDTIAPMTPQLLPLPEATYSASLDISGYGEAGSSVQLYLRGISLKDTIVDKEGDFKFKGVHLRDGENEIYVVAKDDDGNASGESDTYTVTVDTVNPELSIQSPSNGDEFFDKDSPILVKGQSELGINLTINGRFVRVENDGSYEAKVNLKEGSNEIEVKAKDEAGNESRVAVSVNYTP